MCSRRYISTHNQRKHSYHYVNKNIEESESRKNKQRIIVDTKKSFMVVNCYYESTITHNFSKATILVHAIKTIRCCDGSNNNTQKTTKSFPYPSIPFSTTQSCRNIATFHPPSFFSNFTIILGSLKPSSIKSRIRSELSF